MTALSVLIACTVALTLYRRHPSAFRALARYLVREARVRLGTYDLKDLLSAAVVAIEARALPSVTTTYWPNRVVVGLHPDDADRFAGLLGEVAVEVSEIVTAQARGRRDVTLIGGSVHVRLARDPHARPGRPTVGARLVRPGVTAPAPLQVA